MRKIAYICEPYLGGLFSFFLEMRPAFARLGYDLRCVPAGPRSAYLTPLADADGMTFVPEESFRGRHPAEAVVDFLKNGSFEQVICVPGNTDVATLAPAMLPPAIGTIAMVPHNGRGVYRPTAAVQRHLDWVVAVNKLLNDDLTGAFGIPSAKVRTIFIGIDPAKFVPGPKDATPGRLRVAFTSRIEDLQKNVFILPSIMKAAAERGSDITLEILCSGPDLNELKSRAAQLGVAGAITFMPGISRADMLVRLASADAFLMTSRFEGCPHALIEAMASHCVPVVARLPGITDTMIEDGREGWLCELDGPQDYARRLCELAQNPALCAAMGTAARARAAKDFDAFKLAKKYVQLFEDRQPGARALALPFADALRRYGGLNRPTWRAWIPEPLKKVMRTYLAKLGRTA